MPSEPTPQARGSGAIWQITSRGNERHPIFVDDEDRERFLALLGKVAEDFSWRCYAFVLMGNHYHLMAETPEATLSRGMRQLNGVYTLGFNRRHGRVGWGAPGFPGHEGGEVE